MAEANGLRLLTPQERAPYLTSTYGTGQLMRTAVEAGCTTLLIGIGGSATNDGGAGMAQALGAKLLNGEGKEIPRGGGALSQLARIDKQHWLLPTEVRVLVACDVDNPLCGAQGATAIYGPQKGVQPHDVPVLDANLAHFAEVIAHDLGADVAERAGAGAAGGLGAGLMAFCGAEVRSGIEWVMEEVGFTQALAHSDLVLTGEGRIDNQTGRGKVIAGVARRAQAQGVPVVAIAGAVEEGCEAALRSIGLTAAISMMDAPQTLEEAMSATESLLSRKVEQVLALIGIGIR
jgi:glycerate kinase